jgi:UDP-N-acetylglucosamine--N-acetylmuramyl-(pentapeptide) pyrophosphoryl-undecaprenol N-acetylglucosamine transferase
LRLFQQQGISVVINEDTLTPEALLAAVDEVSKHRDEMIKKIKDLAIESATMNIVAIIKEQACVQARSTV